MEDFKQKEKEKCPPLFDTIVIYQLQNQDGAIFRPEIDARIDKGFFETESGWTCYRLSLIHI